MNFPSRVSSILVRIRVNWEYLSINGTERSRKCFLKEHIDVVLFTIETFIRFHEAVKNDLARKGVK